MSSTAPKDDVMDEMDNGPRTPSVAENTSATVHGECTSDWKAQENVEEISCEAKFVEKATPCILLKAKDDETDLVAAPVVGVSVQKLNKKKKRRCHSCRAKLSLVAVECRCGSLFCDRHRYAEDHDCPFDYKAEARAAISKSNPVVMAAKVTPI